MRSHNLTRDSVGLMLWSTYLYCICTAATKLKAVTQIHDESFSPNHILRANVKNITIDCSQRLSVVINGSLPGPALRLRESETHWIRVYNDIADQNLTIHWHGLTQRTAPFSDGTPQASQWPIPPGHFFDYEIRPELGDAGTYFYHSHVGYQAISAHESLILEDRNVPPYEYIDEHTLIVSDYHNKTDDQIVAGLEGTPFQGAGPMRAIAVNGQTGNYGSRDALDSSCAPRIFKVLPGKTYRLRFIGATAKTIVTLGIQDHPELSVIEADGGYVKNVTTDHVNFGPGQRFSVLLPTKSAAELAATNRTAFWIGLENRERRQDWFGYALLQYDVPGSVVPVVIPPKSPLSLPEVVDDWLEYALEPLDVHLDPFPRYSDRTVTIRVS